MLDPTTRICANWDADTEPAVRFLHNGAISSSISDENFIVLYSVSLNNSAPQFQHSFWCTTRPGHRLYLTNMQH